ncbi:GNAT family N-acetyltransferase [Amycolatopsis dendrobii]|uniref:GNAT family N-acetyltransferase n=1 Tax=Amycolatopsis dendrobii TaxID=2760662 RepID=A0A7W3W4V3_9PSEU|nr:GNAT family protein [Amycolatopsis dendrobii]MBB1158889.1 GNAT family N-acetyltransferase [Amycolatopsis dendrobii]
MSRVTLRPLVEADRARVHEILSAPEVSQWWGDPDEETDSLLAKAEAQAYAIEHNGETVGIIQSWEEASPRYRHAGIDLAVHPGHYGLGLGAEAIRILAQRLFDRGHHRITIDPAAANVRAIHVYEKLGFRRVGILRDYEQGLDGTWHDGLLMDLLEGELKGELR